MSRLRNQKVKKQNQKEPVLFDFYPKTSKAFKLDMTFECQQMYPDLLSLLGGKTQAVLLSLS